PVIRGLGRDAGARARYGLAGASLAGAVVLWGVVAVVAIVTPSKDLAGEFAPAAHGQCPGQIGRCVSRRLAGLRPNGRAPAVLAPWPDHPGERGRARGGLGIPCRPGA